MYHRVSVVEAGAEAFAHDARDDRRGMAAAPEMVAQTRRRARGIGAAQRGQTPARDGARPLERVGVVAGQRRVDQGRGDAARAKLGAQARGAVAARRARGHPLAGERGVVEIAAGDEIGEHVGRHVGGRPAAAQAALQLAGRPGAAGEEVGGSQPRGPRVESSARTARGRQDRLKKELPAGETGAGARSLVRCSNDCSPVEKMPRTLRSKSSALVAASRAVS